MNLWCRLAGPWWAILSVAALPAAAVPWQLESDDYPIGLFSVDSPGAMDRAARLGVDFVHTYGLGGGNDEAAIAKARAYLDAAAERGLRVMVNLNGRKWVDAPDGVAELLKLVDALQDHPALGFWYLYDEPDRTHTPEQVQPFYDALRQRTPAIPIAIAAAWTERWYSYQNVLDVLMVDLYPVAGQPFPEARLDNLTRFTAAALRQGKPVIPIAQCFNWRALAGDQTEYRGSPVADLRYPNRAELRYFCYSAAAQGTRGLFWWSQARALQVSPRWLDTDFAPVLQEFREFTKLTRPAHQPVLFAQPPEANLLVAWWDRPDGDWLVAVNAAPIARPLDAALDQRLTSARLTPWGGTRAAAAAVVNSRLTVPDAQPWESFVWRIETP